MEKPIFVLLVVAVSSILMVGLVGHTDIALANEGDHHNHNHAFDLSFFSFIRPLGICAIGSLSVTFLTGLFRRKLGRRFLTVHRIFAFLTIVLALSHGTLVFVLL